MSASFDILSIYGEKVIPAFYYLLVKRNQLKSVYPSSPAFSLLKLNNRFTLSTSKVNVDDVLRDLEAVSSITLPMASISFPSVMNLVWGLGWS